MKTIWGSAAVAFGAMAVINLFTVGITVDTVATLALAALCAMVVYTLKQLE